MGKTQPIKKADDVQRFKEYYLEKKQIRNYTMVTLALNTSLRISDLLHLKWIDVYNFKANKYREHIDLVEQKTAAQAVCEQGCAGRADGELGGGQILLPGQKLDAGQN